MEIDSYFDEELLGREYLRVSLDRRGAGKSPEQQHDDNLRVFDQRRGWRLHSDPYRDDNRSASRYATREREDFERLIADLEAGRFDADALVLWESSRGSRTVEEWAKLCRLCEMQEVRIFVTTHGRLYDPANPRDRKSLLEDAVDAEYESAKLSIRVRRDTAAAAKKGKAHGKNVYGYLRIYHPRTRQLLRIEEHPDQAPIVKEAARRMLAGESAYGIAKDLNARNIPPRRESYKEHNKGRGWQMVAIRQMLEMPAYAGLRQHLPTAKKRKDPKAEPELYPAEWPALISREDWEALQALFATRVRKNDWVPRHLLTGIATCGVCDAILRVGRQNAGRDPETGERKHYNVYLCQGTPGKTGFHVAIKQSFLDHAIAQAIVARCKKPDFLARLGEGEQGVNQERAALLKEIEEHNTYLDEVREQAARTHNISLIIDQEARIQPLVRAAETKLRHLVNADPLVFDIARSHDPKAAWNTFELDEKRRIIRGLVVPIVDRVNPEDRGKRGLDTSRLDRSVWR